MHLGLFLYQQYLQQEAVRREDRQFIENKSKFVLCRASSGHKHSLEEVFSDPSIMSQMTETKDNFSILSITMQLVSIFLSFPPGFILKVRLTSNTLTKVLFEGFQYNKMASIPVLG